MRNKATKQIVRLVNEIMAHVENAKEELDRMNIGNCHDELNHIRTMDIKLEYDEQEETE